MKNSWKVGLCMVGIVLMTICSSANALLITPETLPQWTGPQTSQAQIDVAIAGFLGTSTELYKQDVGGPESGSFAGSYETTFSNSSTDPSDALIEWVVGSNIIENAFLLVKDGNQNPAWYLFDLSFLTWDGMEDLELTGFWPDQGAISHVTLYGNAAPVPEPATMLLFGTGLVGLAGIARRRNKK